MNIYLQLFLQGIDMITTKLLYINIFRKQPSTFLGTYGPIK